MNTESRLTVLQMIPALEAGSIARAAIELGTELVKQGHRSLVISSGGPMVAGLKHHGSQHINWPIGRRSPLTLRFVRRLRRLLLTEEVDILHARSRFVAWLAWLALRGIPMHRRPHFVTTCHDLYPVNYYSSVMTRADRVIAVSETALDYLLDNYPSLSTSRIRLVHRGVATDEFPVGYRPATQWLESWYRQYPQLLGRKMITLPARLTRYKGQFGFVDLMQRLKQSGSDVMGVITGGIDSSSAGHRQLLSRIRDAGIDNIIEAGHRSDTREIYAVSDLVVSLSMDPAAAVDRPALEALSMGIPVAGYDQCSASEPLRELLPEGLVPFGNLEQMHTKVLRMLDSSPRPATNTRFTLEAMLSQIISTYRDLIPDSQMALRTHQGDASFRPRAPHFLSPGHPLREQFDATCSR